MGISSCVELKTLDFPRGMGIILPIFSLPSKYGIGTFGEEAYRFCDFLSLAKVKYWQLLPMGPISYGDSPYQSFSSAAGNPYFIDLDMLCKEGLLEKEEIESVTYGDEPEYINYSLIYNQRYKLLYRAFERAISDNSKVMDDLEAFRKENSEWLDDYAMFQALKSENLDAEWVNWPKAYRDRDEKALADFKEKHGKEIYFHIFIQYHFFKQWKALRKYAKDKGISFIGDIPIYVAHDSADVWANRRIFKLDESGRSLFVAGAPPDAFTEDGQLWGNPVYDWEKMEKDGYAFWQKRLEANFRLYDILRLDHFIGFANYWSVDAGEKTAKNGSWQPGPSFKLFKTMEDKLGPLPVIIEDLGVITDKVIELREKTGFYSMKPMQFAFDPGMNSDYLPHKLDRRTCVYTGTHDSDTLRTWWSNLDTEVRLLVKKYLALNGEEGIRWGLIRGAASGVSDICIFQMQDILWTGEETRMNIPGTVGGNWKWRLDKDYFDPEIIKKLSSLAKLYGR